MNVQEKAKINLEGFVVTVNKLFVTQKINFDLIIASGDSGQEMFYLLKQVLQKLNIETSPFLLLPLYRFKEKGVPSGERFDNSVFQEDVKSVRKKLRKILFLDDEIGLGITIRTFIDLLKNSGKIDNPKVYIVGEDKGVFEKNEMHDVEIIYEPFGKGEKGIMNAISFLVPAEIQKNITKYSGELTTKEIMNSLLDIPIKHKENGKPFWTMGLRDKLVREVPEFENMQLEFKSYINGLIDNYLKQLNTSTTFSS